MIRTDFSGARICDRCVNPLVKNVEKCDCSSPNGCQSFCRIANASPFFPFALSFSLSCFLFFFGSFSHSFFVTFLFSFLSLSTCFNLSFFLSPSLFECLSKPRSFTPSPLIHPPAHLLLVLYPERKYTRRRVHHPIQPSVTRPTLQRSPFDPS